ncbi:MAG: hypothetical protein LBP72_00435 [Dysgonamonadaceae bacterium]|jgi:hypothetical protein|nr:hypothetical protein [Dysgonamonadaceae bacterium]
MTAPVLAKVNTNLRFSASVNTSNICSGEERYEWYKNAGGSTPYEAYPFATTANATALFSTAGTYKVKVKMGNRYSDPAAALPTEQERYVTVTADGGHTPAMLNSNYGLVGAACLDVKKNKQPVSQSQEAFDERINAFSDGSYEKTYKFIHGDAYSDLSLDYVEPANLVEAITVYPPASAIGTAVDGYYEKEFKIKVRSNIQNLVPANGDSLTVQLIASYMPNGSTETKLAYPEIRVEDGTCVCPAKISATQWLNFACHNLDGLDIISPSQIVTRAHHGDWYRWGSQDGFCSES